MTPWEQSLRIADQVNKPLFLKEGVGRGEERQPSWEWGNASDTKEEDFATAFESDSEGKGKLDPVKERPKTNVEEQVDGIIQTR